MTSPQYGVAYVHADGTEHISPMLNQTAAMSLLVAHSGPGWLPRAVRVMRREVGVWTARHHHRPRTKAADRPLS